MNADPQTFSKLWETFHSSAGDEEVDLSPLRPFVRESWLRCKASSLSPSTSRAPTVLDEDSLRQLRAQSSLVQAASPIIDLTFDAIRDISGGLLLMVADSQGRILYHLVNAAAAGEVERINTISGSRCDESAMGTDSLACCLRLERPLSIRWYEHYLEVGHPWVGHAAPIKDLFSNRLAGVISLYSYQRDGHAKAHELIGRGAELTERCLYAKGAATRLLIGESYEATRERYRSDPCLAITADGQLLKASPEASRLLGISSGGARSVSTLSELGVIAKDTPLSRSTRTLTLRDRSGALAEAIVSPVADGANIVGFVAVMDNGHQSATNSSPWSAKYTFSDIVGTSPKFLSCLTQARRVAETDDPVLLTGESGTGKELFAQAIHNTSARRNRPFIPINCGGLSDELLGAELFGYVEGAFTGATRKGRLGKFRSAHGGTLFLDEVEAMSPRMQSHLLRVLEEKRVFPVGSEDPFEADIRVIAATNVDLTERINEKSFREDLYYRLSCHTLRLPPLRERRSDIALLVQSFLATNRIEVTSSALGRMEDYCWPGNVRELRNVLAQARQTVSDFTINDDDLPAWPACHHASCRRAKAAGESEPRTASPTRSLQNTERETILRALRDADNNHGKAAVLLGVSRATLYRKLKRHRIRPDYF